MLKVHAPLWFSIALKLTHLKKNSQNCSIGQYILTFSPQYGSSSINAASYTSNNATHWCLLVDPASLVIAKVFHDIIGVIFTDFKQVQASLQMLYLCCQFVCLQYTQEPAEVSPYQDVTAQCTMMTYQQWYNKHLFFTGNVI